MTGQAGNNGQDRGGAVDRTRRDAVSERRDAAGQRRDAGGQRRDAGGQRDLGDDIQRWLVRSGVRSMRRELTDQVRRAFHAHRPAEPADVWDAATTEPPELLAASAEAPECAWCPVCRAARRIRESGPAVGGLGGQLGEQLGGQLAGAGDAVAAAVQEAFSAFESLLSAARPRTGSGFPTDQYPADRFPADRFPPAGTPPREAGHEPDDRG
jgi:hypothetical protein